MVVSKRMKGRQNTRKRASEHEREGKREKREREKKNGREVKREKRGRERKSCFSPKACHCKTNT
jgi:hypothetical protein